MKKGEFVAITGPSGSGKSSLLYLLGLLDAPSEGEVIICGQPTSKLSESDRADVRLTKCGFVFQFHFLLPEFTSLDNVLLPMRAAGKMSEPRCASAALRCSARSGSPSTPTSVPTSSPAASASASPLRARLPTAPRSSWPTSRPAHSIQHRREQVFSILRDIADQGQTVVVVTHDPALAARADRRIHIVDGKIAEITGRRGWPVRWLVSRGLTETRRVARSTEYRLQLVKFGSADVEATTVNQARV